MTKLIGLIYPFTKAKLHRALHFAGILVTAVSVLAVWLSSLDVSTKTGATIGLISVALTNIKAGIAKLEPAIDSLPIPADDTPTQPLPKVTP